MDKVEAFIKSGIYLRNWSPRTVSTYRQGLAILGDTELTKIGLDGWVVALRSRGVTANGTNMYIRTVNSYLSWLYEEGHLGNRLRIKLLRAQPRPKMPITLEDMRLLKAFKPGSYFQQRTHTLVLLLADTGLRISEALSLERDRTNLDDLQLVVAGKGGKWRNVPISESGRKALWRLRQAKNHRLVFDGLAYRNAYRDIKVLCSWCKVNPEHVHPHAFRHFFTVGYIRNGGDIYRLSRILGHTSLSTTQIYLRSLGVEAVQEAHSDFSPLARL